MKKDHSLFNSGVYLESLRQFRLMGLIYLVCCVLFSFLPALLSCITGSTGTPAVTDQAAVLFLYMYLAPLTLSFGAFGFLTRRNASDFYHSLPVRRVTLYFCRVLAVLTYLAGTVVLSLLASYLAYGLFGCTLVWSRLPCQIGYFLSSCLLVTACSLIGICSTGTYFSAFIVTGLVMFLPRFISFLIAQMVEHIAPIVSASELGFLFDYNLNLPVSLAASLLSMGYYASSDLSASMTNWTYIAYTSGVAVVYLAAAGIIFRRRASETASMSAPSRFMQHLYRCAISLPLFLLAGLILLCDWDIPETLVLVLCAAFLTYFVYELITTRKVRSLLSALCVLPLVLAVSIGIPLLGQALGRRAMHNIPEKEEVASVQFTAPSDSTYSALQLSRLCYSEENLISSALQNLSSTVAVLDRNGELRGNSESVTFRLKNGTTLTRLIYFSDSDLLALQKEEASSADYLSAQLALPKESEISSISSVYGLADKDCRELWESFRAEYETLSSEEKLLLNESSTYAAAVPENAEAEAESAAVSEDSDSLTVYNGFLYVSGVSGADTFYSSYPLTTLTPRTLLLFLQKLQTLSAQETVPSLCREASEALRTMDVDVLWFDGSFTCFRDGKKVFESSPGLYWETETLTQEKLDTFKNLGSDLMELLSQADTEITDPKDNFVLVGYLDLQISPYSEEGAGYSIACRAFGLSDAQLETLISLLGQLSSLNE